MSFHEAYQETRLPQQRQRLGMPRNATRLRVMLQLFNAKEYSTATELLFGTSGDPDLFSRTPIGFSIFNMLRAGQYPEALLNFIYNHRWQDHPGDRKLSLQIYQGEWFVFTLANWPESVMEMVEQTQ